jgi:hypothetical protein
MNSAHANNVHKNNEKTSPINLHRNRPPLALLAAILATLGSGCGGSSSTSSHTLSAAQAQAVSGQVVQAVTAALGDALGATPAAANGSRHSLSTVMANAHPDASSSGCTSTATGQSCNLPLSYTGPCSGGGSISVSGDISGTLDNSGDGSFGTQMTITPSNCSVSGTTFNGDPDITIAGQIAFTDENFVYPITFMEGEASPTVPTRPEPVRSV